MAQLGVTVRAAFALFGYLVAGQGIACTSPGQLGCVVPSGDTDDNDGVGMLQATSSAHRASKSAKKVRKFIDMGKVWEQMRGAVEIDQVKGALADAKGYAKEKLQDKLKTLQDAFPSAEEIKDKFSDQWNDITSAVDMEELQSMISEAKKTGAENLKDLQSKLSELAGKINIDSIKAKAQSAWDSMQDKLPDLDDLTGHLKSVARHAKESFHGAWDKAKTAWGSITDSSDGDTVTGMVDQAKDAVNSAWESAKGWFR